MLHVKNLIPGLDEIQAELAKVKASKVVLLGCRGGEGGMCGPKKRIRLIHIALNYTAPNAANVLSQ